MDKWKRAQRLAVLARLLGDQPNRLMGLEALGAQFEAAKSTMSEDLALIDDAWRRFGLGKVDTLAGAAGGVRFQPVVERAKALAFVEGIVARLQEPDRLLPGDYLYLSDILSEPETVRMMGQVLASPYQDAKVDFVLTMETKGIPVALMAAEALGVPLVIARRASRVYEGSAVNISYLSGKNQVESMALSRRAVKEGQTALIVDDFIRQGGTARGMVALMAEFRCQVAGLCFVLAQADPENSVIAADRALITFSGGGDRPMRFQPGRWLTEGVKG